VAKTRLLKLDDTVYSDDSRSMESAERHNVRRVADDALLPEHIERNPHTRAWRIHVPATAHEGERWSDDYPTAEDALAVLEQLEG